MANGASNHQVAGVVDPTTGGELLELRPIQLARRPEVHIFDSRTDMTQLCAAHTGLEAPGVAAGDLAFDQQAKPFGVAEIGGVILFVHLDKGISHSVKLQLSQLFQGGVGQHRFSFQGKLSGQWK